VILVVGEIGLIAVAKMEELSRLYEEEKKNGKRNK